MRHGMLSAREDLGDFKAERMNTEGEPNRPSHPPVAFWPQISAGQLLGVQLAGDLPGLLVTASTRSSAPMTDGETSCFGGLVAALGIKGRGDARPLPCRCRSHRSLCNRERRTAVADAGCWRRTTFRLSTAPLPYGVLSGMGRNGRSEKGEETDAWRVPQSVAQLAADRG